MIGKPAPDFTLPAVHREGDVSLADYRGKPLLLAIFAGLYCPFCRRNIAQLGGTQQKLHDMGVETLGVVATEVDNARLYFKYRPARVPLVADPELTMHRAYSLPRVQMDEALQKAFQTVPVDPLGTLPEPMPLAQLGPMLDRADGFQRTASDLRDMERQFPQLKGQFLIDAEGIVRWVNVECSNEGITGVGKFPSDDDLLAAAGSMK
jgi:peroxiredoxin